MKLVGSPEQQNKLREFIEQVGSRIDADWRRHMPRAVNDPWLKSADVLVKYKVRKDGELTDMAVTMTSGRESYDASATRAIRESAPFPLPSGVDGPFEMCMRFRYNPKQEDALPRDPFAPKPAKPATQP
jgi:TonB family protein